MESAGVDFDLNGPTGFFKSSFARSMAFSDTQSKSLDYVYLDEKSTINEETAGLGQKPAFDVIGNFRKPRRSVPTLPTFDPAFPRDSTARLKTRGTNDAIKFWKMKQDAAIKKSISASTEDTLIQEETKDEEILRLRKECQGLMETNRKLQAGSGNFDSCVLQTQIDTLQWQLKQAESNRQMYKAVMEQVSKFLERVQKALDSSPKVHPTRGKSRVPRSRSVHTVVTQSRASSPSPSASSTSVHRANSISQIQDSYSTFRDYACSLSRRTSRASVDEESPERLSQDAFRLLRTIQSLLATREPDLARVSDGTPRDTTSMGSCSSLVQSSCGVSQEDKSSSSAGPATPQLSVGSTEDESGFSSMSSFHENVTSERTSTANSEGSHHELGLPLVTSPHRHRRWSSTPTDGSFRQPIRVLWKGTGLEVPNSAYKKTNTVNKLPYPHNFRYEYMQT